MKNVLSKVTKNGFYIILFLCICAVGISGYVMVKTPQLEESAEILGDWGDLELPVIEETKKELEPASNPIEVPKPEQKPEIEAPKKQELPASKKIENIPKKQTPKFQKAVEGDVLVPFSGEELVKSKTLGDWRTHPGVDIKAKDGEQVKAIADGTVLDVYCDEMMGYTVKIQHEDKTVSTYQNLMKGVVVKKGDKVTCGQVIGGVGATAKAESLEEAHLHLEVEVDGKRIDPMSIKYE